MVGVLDGRSGFTRGDRCVGCRVGPVAVSDSTVSWGDRPVALTVGGQVWEVSLIRPGLRQGSGSSASGGKRLLA